MRIPRRGEREKSMSNAGLMTHNRPMSKVIIQIGAATNYRELIYNEAMVMRVA